MSLIFHLLLSLVFHLLFRLSSSPSSFIFSLLSRLVFSLVFHLLSRLSSSLLSRFSSSLLSRLSSSLVSRLVFLSPCVVVVVVCLVCCVLCVVSCVLCLVLWCDTLKTHPVCPFKTSPCVPATRAHVFYTCARVAGTHGDILNGHTEGFSACHTTTQHNTQHTTHNNTQQHTTTHKTQDTRQHTTQHSSPKFAHVGLLRASEVHQKKPLDLTHSRFENRSRTRCCRFLQSFALPEGNKLSGM